MALITSTGWGKPTSRYETLPYWHPSYGMTQKRRAVSTWRLEWTCDKDATSVGSAPASGYYIANQGFIPDERFKFIGLPTAGPAGVWFEVWLKVGNWEYWNGSSWVAVPGEVSLPV